MVDPSLVDTVLPNVGSITLVVYLMYEIRFGRVADALDTYEERIDRNALAHREWAREIPTARPEAFDRLLDPETEQLPHSDELFDDADVSRWHDHSQAPADGEDSE